MNVAIFTEGSSTTVEEPEGMKAEEYFRGAFLPIAKLAGELREYGEVDTHILSEAFGHIQGDELVSELSEYSEGSIQSFQSSFLTAAAESDVICVFLTNDTFNNTIEPKWCEAVENANSGVVWCIGLSPSALRSLKLEVLENKEGGVVTYERVGVARIGTEARNELFKLLDLRLATDT